MLLNTRLCDVTPAVQEIAPASLDLIHVEPHAILGLDATWSVGADDVHDEIEEGLCSAPARREV